MSNNAPLVYAYLRASTKEQDATRAKDQLKEFACEHNTRIAAWFIENVSGASLHRPELMRLLETAEPGDALLIESIDRLTRMHSDDWQSLKEMINAKGLKIIAVDLPTTYLSLKSDELTDSIMLAINQLIIDILAAIARKDYLQRRQRQKQGIKKAKALGKFQGRKPNIEMHHKVLKMLQAGMTYSEIQSTLKVSSSTIARVRKNKPPS